MTVHRVFVLALSGHYSTWRAVCSCGWHDRNRHAIGLSRRAAARHAKCSVWDVPVNSTPHVLAVRS